MSILEALSPASSALGLLNTSGRSAGTQSSPRAAAAGSSTGSGSSSSGTNAFSVNNLGSTFLNLLVQELQNQDPTSPMDPTAMVGQMISLNQLSQLISINQSLTPTSAAGSSTTGSGSTSGTATSAAAIQAALAALSPASTPAAATAAGTTDPTLAGLSFAGSAAQPSAASVAAAAALYGHGVPSGRPAGPIDLSKFQFVAGGK